MRVCRLDGQPLRLRSLNSDQRVGDFAEVKGGDYSGCFSADGRTVALLGRGKEPELVFLDVPGRRVRSHLTTKQSVQDNLVLSRDGKLLAAPCADQTVMLIDTFRGQIVRRLGTPLAPSQENEPRVSLSRGAFSPDSDVLAFGTHVERPVDRRMGRFGGLDAFTPDVPGIRIWQVATGRELRQFADCLKNTPHGRIASLSFSPDSRSLATALSFNPYRVGDPGQATVPILELASGRFRREFKGHIDQVTVVAFSADGGILASGSNDATIVLWDMQRPSEAEPATSKPSADVMLRHWNKLAEADPVTAYDAVLALAKLPNRCVAFLAKHLQAVKPTTSEEIAKWIVDLEANSSNVREEAAMKLADLHERALPALKRALDSKPSLEAQRRLTQLVDQIDAMRYSPS